LLVLKAASVGRFPLLEDCRVAARPTDAVGLSSSLRLSQRRERPMDTHLRFGRAQLVCPGGTCLDEGMAWLEGWTDQEGNYVGFGDFSAPLSPASIRWPTDAQALVRFPDGWQTAVRLHSFITDDGPALMQVAWIRAGGVPQPSMAAQPTSPS